jgi:hypothetical protein
MERTIKGIGLIYSDGSCATSLVENGKIIYCNVEKDIKNMLHCTPDPKTIQFVKDMSAMSREDIEKAVNGIWDEVGIDGNEKLRKDIIDEFANDREYDEKTWKLLKDALRKAKEVEEDRTLTFEKICDGLISLHRRKNHDYGNAFGDLYNELGMPYAIGHLQEKVNRIKNVWKKGAKVDESITDSLMDLASYAIMTLESIDECDNG